MLSVGELRGGGGSADYYLRRQADCPAEYYLGSGERPGVWVGWGATVLGLTGTVDAVAFTNLLAGRSVDGSGVLVGPKLRVDRRGMVAVGPLVGAARRVAAERGVRAAGVLGGRLAAAYGRVERAHAARGAGVVVRADVAGRIAVGLGVDPLVLWPAGTGTGGYADALRHVNRRVDSRVAGFDLTFSAPKSVSVLFGLAGPAVGEAVRAGHEAAVIQALGYVERVAGHGLRGHHGDGRRAARVDGLGVVGVAFPHRSSRCGDPQLHTHVVVVNQVTGVDGRVSALDSRALYRQAKTAGFVYQAALRAELSARLGVEWTSVRRGVGELVGVPTGVCRVFSKRRAAIDAVLAAGGVGGRDAAQRAALVTRPAKDTTVRVAGLRDRWAREAADAGFDPTRLVEVLDRGPRRRPPIPERAEWAAVTGRLLGPDGVTARATSVDRRDVVQACCAELPGGAAVRVVEGLADRLLTDPAVVRLAARGGHDRYTTVELLGVEARALRTALARRADTVGRVDPRLVNDAQQPEHRNTGTPEHRNTGTPRRLCSTSTCPAAISLRS